MLCHRAWGLGEGGWVDSVLHATGPMYRRAVSVRRCVGRYMASRRRLLLGGISIYMETGRSNEGT